MFVAAAAEALSIHKQNYKSHQLTSRTMCSISTSLFNHCNSMNCDAVESLVAIAFAHRLQSVTAQCTIALCIVDGEGSTMIFVLSIIMRVMI